MGAWEHGSMGAWAMSWASQCDNRMRRECGYDFCGRALISRLRVLKSASSARLHALLLSQQIARAAPSVRGARQRPCRRVLCPGSASECWDCKMGPTRVMFCYYV